MSKPVAPKWNDRDIVDPADADELDRTAAVYEFKHRMPRHDAEHRAHHEYQQQKHREAAAYHLTAMKAARAAGSHEDGQKHGLLYQLHLKALGLDSTRAVPKEIESLAAKQDQFYHFKPHRGDAFILAKSHLWEE